jgi:hypothetical protein
VSDLSTVAAYRRAFAKTGQTVTFQRLVPGSGVTFIAINLKAIVGTVLPDRSAVSREGYSAGKPGAITQADRRVLAMKDDLANLGFPLPVQKGDRILVIETAEWLQVEDVDNGVRYYAGCVEIVAKGVA